LIQAVKNSKILESNRVYKITSQDDSHIFSSRIYKILTPNKANPKSINQKPINLGFQKALAIIFGLTLMLSSGIIFGSQHYPTLLNKLNLFHNKQ